MKDLDEEELQIVHTVALNRLQMYTVGTETLKDAMKTEKTTDMQH